MIILFAYIVVNMFKERYISSGKSYKYLNRLISLNFLKNIMLFKNTMHRGTVPLIKL